MSSRKEEERNEKIIRGLMKLPPNRRCINCNSLGPQYVCTNFWSFVCMTCSGIHREFTHRVKSVSMAKFTSQEVEALQRGGNQRARETFLKDWDPQRQRLPDSSNIDRVREFIKNVYVDRKYAGAKTSDKPPRDTQNLRNNEDDTRRASSYHSYSQSPPYEHQYEDRRYGKQAGVLTRKPGSDRGHYEGKLSSFIYSPGRYEDGFANESSGSRVSDYSVSSGGDPFRSDTQSPNFQKDIGFSSPPVHLARDISVDDLRRQTISSYREANAKQADGISRPQRTASLGSFGSFDSNSLKSANSGSLFDVVSEPEQPAGSHQGIMHSFPSLPQSSVNANVTSLDPSNAPFVQQPATSAPSLDLFQPSATSSTPSIDLFQPPPTSFTPSLDLFQQPPTSSAPSLDLFQQPPTSSAPSLDLFQQPPTSFAPSLDLFQQPSTSSTLSIDLFADITQQSATNVLEQKPSEFSFLENEGWATFDLPQHAASTTGTKNVAPANMYPSDGVPVGSFDSWQSVQSSAAHGPVSLTSNQWHGTLQDVQAPTSPMGIHSWNAFEDTSGIPSQASFENLPERSEPQPPPQKPPATTNQYLSSKVSEDPSKDGFQGAAVEDIPPVPYLPIDDLIPASSFTPLGGLPSHGTDKKSTNPFDIPYDSNLEASSMFLDMSSLQAALPNPQLPPAFLGGLSQQWFPQNPVTPYVPAAPQGSLAYIAGQAPSSQLPNVASQGPVASLGGNPFA